MHAVLIRDATIDDLPEIVAIYNASVPSRRSTADTQEITVESRRRWFYNHDARRPLWVVEDAGRVIAYLSFRNFYGRPAYHITAELAVYVDPACQGRGIGGRLLSRAIREAPSLGLENLLAFVFAHNDLSIRLFEQHGFERRGLLPAIAELDGRRMDLLILARKVRSEQ